jgi:hypothetical protein
MNLPWLFPVFQERAVELDKCALRRTPKEDDDLQSIGLLKKVTSFALVLHQSTAMGS